MELYDWSIYTSCLLIYFIIGYSLISSMLFEDYEIKSNIPLLIFSTIFSFSAMLLQMIIFEIMNIGTEDARYLKWIITLCTLTYATIFLLPSLLLFKFLINIKIGNKLKIILAMILSTTYLWIMLKLLANETLAKQPDHEAGIFAMFLPIMQVEFLGKIGIFFLAILSGFGAVNCPFTFFNLYDKNVTKLNKFILQDKILMTLEHIKKIKIENYALRTKFQQNGSEKEQSKFSLWQFLFGRKLSPIESLLSENEKIIKMLRETHNEAFDDYCEFIEEQRKLQLSNSLYGKFLNFLAKILSLYCLYRITMSTINVILGRKSGLDPINKLLDTLVMISNIELSKEHVDLICSNMSFVIFGFLIFNNIRSFTNNILQFFRIFMKSYSSEIISSDLIVYLLSELILKILFVISNLHAQLITFVIYIWAKRNWENIFSMTYFIGQSSQITQNYPQIYIYIYEQMLGIYFVSTLLMMQNSFPYQFKENINTVLGDIDYNKHYNRFDVIFIISSLGSILIIGLNMIVKKSKYQSYAREAQEDHDFIKGKWDQDN